MAAYTKTAFEAGQSTDLGIYVNEQSYLPSRTAINVSIKEILERERTKFAEDLGLILKNVGGAVSIDSATLKIQGRHYIDFTLQYVEVIRQKDVVSAPKFKIQSKTILFVESSDVTSGINLGNHLGRKFRLL